MCLIWGFFHKEKYNYHFKILEMLSTLSPSLKIPECINMQIFIISKVYLLDTRCLLPHCKVHSQCMCSGGFNFPHYITHLCKLNIGAEFISKLVVMSQIMLVGSRPKLRFKVRTEKLSSFTADECENNLLVSNSAHPSFCTVKHPTVGTRRKTYF